VKVSPQEQSNLLTNTWTVHGSNKNEWYTYKTLRLSLEDIKEEVCKKGSWLRNSLSNQKIKKQRSLKTYLLWQITGAWASWSTTYAFYCYRTQYPKEVNRNKRLPLGSSCFSKKIQNDPQQFANINNQGYPDFGLKRLCSYTKQSLTHDETRKKGKRNKLKDRKKEIEERNRYMWMYGFNQDGLRLVHLFSILMQCFLQLAVDIFIICLLVLAYVCSIHHIPQVTLFCNCLSNLYLQLLTG